MQQHGSQQENTGGKAQLPAANANAYGEAEKNHEQTGAVHTEWNAEPKHHAVPSSTIFKEDAEDIWSAVRRITKDFCRD
jgi:hypothetical protein